jgi:tRNA threonylcarbamoyladenosine biosynthesis protein TsaE
MGAPAVSARPSIPPGAAVLESDSEARTLEIARALAAHLRPGDVVALHGPLGAGKTRFVRGLAAGLGLDADAVSSPTFILLQEYGAEGGRGARLAHIDAYRISGPEELETIGWQELLASGDAVIVIEWAERLGEELPDRRIDVVIDHLGPERRRIEITPRGRDLPAAVEARPCPACGKAVPPGAVTAPFCSGRCRMADLGAWFSEGYRVSRPLRDDDEIEDLPED